MIIAPLLVAPQSVVLRYKFHAGQTVRFQMSMQMNMQSVVGGKSMPTKVEMSEAVMEKVKSVAPDGTATLEMIVQKGTTTVNGKSTPIPGANTVSSMRMTPLGGMSGLSIPGAKGLPEGISSLQTAGSFPRGPVHVGSRWESGINIPKLGKTIIHMRVEQIARSGASTLVHIGGTGTLDVGKLMAAFGGGLKGVKGAGHVQIQLNQVFDAGKGTLERLQQSSLYDMKMTVPGGPNGQTMPVVSKGAQSMIMKRLP